mgnify:FL=1
MKKKLINIGWIKEGERDIIVVKNASGTTIFTCQKFFWDTMPSEMEDNVNVAVLRDALLRRALKLYG